MSNAWKLLVVGFLVAVGTSQEAIAGERESPRWTGSYVGIDGGWLRSSTDVKLDSFTSAFGAVVAAGTVPLGINDDEDSFLVGVQAGTGEQHGGWYFGVAGDVSWTNIDGQAVVNLPRNGFFVPTSTTVTTEMDWLATLRVRLGIVAAQNLLVYATGGAAFANVSHNMRLAFNPTNAGNFSGSTSSDFEAGWTAGGGGEWAIDSNWSAQAEYLYYDLNNSRATLFDPVNFPTQSITYEFENTGQMARIGLNYKFSYLVAPN